MISKVSIVKDFAVKVEEVETIRQVLDDGLPVFQVFCFRSKQMQDKEVRLFAKVGDLQETVEAFGQSVPKQS